MSTSTLYKGETLSLNSSSVYSSGFVSGTLQPIKQGTNESVNKVIYNTLGKLLIAYTITKVSSGDGSYRILLEWKLAQPDPNYSSRGSMNIYRYLYNANGDYGYVSIVNAEQYPYGVFIEGDMFRWSIEQIVYPFSNIGGRNLANSKDTYIKCTYNTVYEKAYFEIVISKNIRLYNYEIVSSPLLKKGVCPLIFIKANTDPFTGQELGQCVFTAPKQYSQYLMLFREYIIRLNGSDCTLSDKIIAITNRDYQFNQALKVFNDIVSYGLLKYFLWERITGKFNLAILQQRYNDKFIARLSNSNYSCYLNDVQSLSNMLQYFIE